MFCCRWRLYRVRYIVWEVLNLITKGVNAFNLVKWLARHRRPQSTFNIHGMFGGDVSLLHPVSFDVIDAREYYEAPTACLVVSLSVPPSSLTKDG